MDRISLRRGTSAPDASRLCEYEPGYCTSERALYLRDGGEAVRLCSEASAAGEFPRLRLTARGDAASAPNGTLFEGADGALYYKNLGGVTVRLASENAE